MTITAHHALGASGAPRWMRCLGSVRLSEKYPDSPSSYADEGTVAALIAEDLFNGIPMPKPGLVTLYRFDNEEPVSATLNADDLEAVEEYVTTVRSPHIVRTLFDLPTEAELEQVEEFIEHRVDLSRWISGAFSTLDHAAVWRLTGLPRQRKPRYFLVVTDLKFGLGVPVSAQGNEQLGLYLGGMLDELELDYAFEGIAGVISQPRLGRRSWQIYTESEVRQFMSRAAALAEQTIRADAPVTPGPIQCRWCRAKGECRARAEYLIAQTRPGLKIRPDPLGAELLMPDEIAELLPTLSELSDWIESVKSAALDLASKGGLPGYKLIAGRSVRQWSDEVAMRQAILNAALDPEDFQSTSFFSPAQAEKKLGKKRFVELGFSELIEKPPGKPQVAPESDPRPAYRDTMASQFDDLTATSTGA